MTEDPNPENNHPEDGANPEDFRQRWTVPSPRAPRFPSYAYIPSSLHPSTCAACGKEGAANRCSRCLIKTDEHETFRVLYCGKDCQTKHWKSHKTLCKELAQLHRASKLFVEAFELSNTIFWDLPTAQDVKWNEVVVKDGVVTAYCEKLPDGPVPNSDKDQQTKDWFTFHEEDFPSREAAEVVKYHGADLRMRNHYLNWLQLFILPIDEFIIWPKNIHTPFVLVDKPTATPLKSNKFGCAGYSIAVLELRSGASVVLDPAGKSMGWKETLGGYGEGIMEESGRVRHPPERVGCRLHTPYINRGPTVGVLSDSMALAIAGQIEDRLGGVLQFSEKGTDSQYDAVREAIKKGITFMAKKLADDDWVILPFDRNLPNVDWNDSCAASVVGKRHCPGRRVICVPKDRQQNLVRWMNTMRRRPGMGSQVFNILLEEEARWRNILEPHVKVNLSAA
ncbi:hypothetical protein QBC40DRAFT_346450 [Triangularia verruculosa]|uniref:MYND-type domain-containing protein n=1 Tax=Triangularia verruculosa TaxID=2587418 RepID=A0AAN7AY15_9PEZI|nr:hypothetical protein QBC40DRAFT_346450 [Triangularia verruculosa]